MGRRLPLRICGASRPTPSEEWRAPNVTAKLGLVAPVVVDELKTSALGHRQSRIRRPPHARASSNAGLDSRMARHLLLGDLRDRDDLPVETCICLGAGIAASIRAAAFVRRRHCRWRAPDGLVVTPSTRGQLRRY